MDDVLHTQMSGMIRMIAEKIADTVEQGSESSSQVVFLPQVQCSMPTVQGRHICASMRNCIATAGLQQRLARANVDAFFSVDRLGSGKICDRRAKLKGFGLGDSDPLADHRDHLAQGDLQCRVQSCVQSHRLAILFTFPLTAEIRYLCFSWCKSAMYQTLAVERPVEGQAINGRRPAHLRRTGRNRRPPAAGY